jgi:hypothetical protein
VAGGRLNQGRLNQGRLNQGRLNQGRLNQGLSDADQLARLTRVPAGVWVSFFALVALVALAGGARLLIPWPAHLLPHSLSRG